MNSKEAVKQAFGKPFELEALVDNTMSSIKIESQKKL